MEIKTLLQSFAKKRGLHEELVQEMRDQISGKQNAEEKAATD